MKTIFVVNTKKYAYHKKILEDLTEAARSYGEAGFFDMSENIPFHEQYYKMQDAGADLLITVDCAGFEIKTENNTLAYNQFGCRMAHLLFQNREEYGDDLGQQMNFSMFLFSAKEEDVLFLAKNCPNIPNVERLDIPENVLKMSQGNLINTESERIGWAEAWFSYIVKEAELL